MKRPTPLQRAREAAQAFLAPIEGGFWEEHGITDDEATLGMIATLEHLGTFTEQDATDARIAIECEKEAERDRWMRQEEKRRNKLTPEAREHEDTMSRIHHDLMDREYKRLLETIGVPPNRTTSDH